jgi:hypothetical protein
MELTKGSETSANYNYNMTPGKYPKEHIQYSKHGESLKSTKLIFISPFLLWNSEIYTCFNYQLNAQFLYSIIVYILHYNPRHVSSNIMLILRRSNCIVSASGIVTLCKRPYSEPIESGLSPLSIGALYRVTIPDAVTIQFDLLRMSIVLLETCRWL